MDQNRREISNQWQSTHTFSVIVFPYRLCNDYYKKKFFLAWILELWIWNSPDSISVLTIMKQWFWFLIWLLPTSRLSPTFVRPWVRNILVYLIETVKIWNKCPSVVLETADNISWTKLGIMSTHHAKHLEMTKCSMPWWLWNSLRWKETGAIHLTSILISFATIKPSILLCLQELGFVAGSYKTRSTLVADLNKTAITVYASFLYKAFSELAIQVFQVNIWALVSCSRSTSKLIKCNIPALSNVM